MQLSNKRLTTMNTIRHLIRTDPTVFVRGMSVPMVSFPIDRAISYKIYEDLNNLKFNPYQSAFVGGIFSSFFNVPMQYITTNAINTDKKQYKGIKKLITVTMNNKKDLYRGYSFDTVRSISGSTIFLGTYGNIKKTLPENDISTVISSLGAITVTWITTFPLDTLRALRQTSLSNESLLVSTRKKIATDGIRSLYRGLTPVMIRSIPSTCFGMLVYEKVKIYIKN